MTPPKNQKASPEPFHALLQLTVNQKFTLGKKKRSRRGSDTYQDMALIKKGGEEGEVKRIISSRAASVFVEKSRHLGPESAIFCRSLYPLFPIKRHQKNWDKKSVPRLTGPTSKWPEIFPPKKRISVWLSKRRAPPQISPEQKKNRPSFEAGYLDIPFSAIIKAFLEGGGRETIAARYANKMLLLFPRFGRGKLRCVRSFNKGLFEFRACVCSMGQDQLS